MIKAKTEITCGDQIGQLSAKLQKAMEVLSEASQYSNDVAGSSWDFAIEIGLLRRLGLNQNDLRWLVKKELVETARELTLFGDREREFRFDVGVKFTKRSCFILTKKGLEFARSKNVVQSETDKTVAPPSEQPKVDLPSWCGERRELRLGASLVKHFKVPASNQEAILDCFQEENWPHRIDDPLPPKGEMDPKRRLHAAINSLNRNQKTKLIRFHGDGRGEGICWEKTVATN